MPPRNKKPTGQTEPAAMAEHPLVTELLAATGADTPEPMSLLYGYLGHSPSSGHWRLYLSATLNDYVEIPEDAVLANDVLPGNRGNRVWVRAGTDLVRRTTTTQSVQAEFLSGGISGRATSVARRNPAVSGFVPGLFTLNPTYVQTHCPTCRAGCPINSRGCPPYSDAVDCSDFFGCNPLPTDGCSTTDCDSTHVDCVPETAGFGC